MPNEYIETLIIGGGQAGLAMSDMLSQRRLPHLIVEQHRIAERWRSERWTGLCFQFPNWSIRLPGYKFEHADPNGFATSSEIVDFLTAYAVFIKAPVRSGVKVTRRASTAVGPISWPRRPPVPSKPATSWSRPVPTSVL
jgi:putative flavoprotein involved in K+ transport